jgi:hypothetical protein
MKKREDFAEVYTTLNGEVLCDVKEHQLTLLLKCDLRQKAQVEVP